MECIYLSFLFGNWLVLGDGCSNLFLSLFSSSAILLATVVNHHSLGSIVLISPGTHTSYILIFK